MITGAKKRLLRACKSGDTTIVRLLIEKGADVSIENENGMTPLHLACFYNHPDLVRLLLDHGADVNARGKDGCTPIHDACYAISRDILRLLLSHGADVNARNKKGSTPLDLWMTLPPDHSEREKELDLFREYAPELALESVVKLPHEDPLREKTLEWYREHHPEMVMEAWCTQETMIGQNTMKKSIIDINIVTASKENKPEIVRSLIEAGSSANERDTGGYTGLHWACQSGFVDVVRILVEGGADVNIKSAERTGSTTPLHLACLFHGVEIVHLLLSHGADPAARNQEHWTSLDYLRRIPVTNPAREQILDLFRQYAPEMVMEVYCSPGPGA